MQHLWPTFLLQPRPWLQRSQSLKLLPPCLTAVAWVTWTTRQFLLSCFGRQPQEAAFFFDLFFDLGHQQTLDRACGMAALYPKAPCASSASMSAKCQKGTFSFIEAVHQRQEPHSGV